MVRRLTLWFSSKVSGHGIFLDSKKGEGKEAREIPKDADTIETGDAELDASSPDTLVNSIKVPKDKIKYYNEAIVTSYKQIPLRRLRLGDNPLDYNIVRDNELNEQFAKLPEGCRLTCTFDCCHSGRLINSNFKLAEHYEEGDSTHDPTTIPEPSFADMTVAGLSAVPGIIRNWISPPLIKPPTLIPTENTNDEKTTTNVVELSNKLPAEELTRDKIKADVLAWSACHQRQRALDYDEKEGGVFTRAFTKVISQIKGTKKTLNEVYEMVNQHIKDDIKTKSEEETQRNAKDGTQKMTNQPFPTDTALLQYTQVWTSLGESGDEKKAVSLLLHKPNNNLTVVIIPTASKA
ncbi:metacaspase protein [Ceratobasidium sp. AG-Ba]|nr:metacaspase protein [Ceratobasidium sp. AG-Ba]